MQNLSYLQLFTHFSIFQWPWVLVTYQTVNAFLSYIMRIVFSYIPLSGMVLFTFLKDNRTRISHVIYV